MYATYIAQTHNIHTHTHTNKNSHHTHAGLTYLQVYIDVFMHAFFHHTRKLSSRCVAAQGGGSVVFYDKFTQYACIDFNCSTRRGKCWLAKELETVVLNEVTSHVIVLSYHSLHHSSALSYRCSLCVCVHVILIILIAAQGLNVDSTKRTRGLAMTS